MKLIHRVLACCAVAIVTAPTAAEMTVLSEGKAIQIMTDEFVVRSTLIDRDFLIEVSRVDGLQPGQKTAAIYATDGGFGLVGPASRVLMADGKIPRVHVISIGYQNERGRHAGPRHLDLTHGHFDLDGLSVDGVGEAFEAFILDELRPYIESRYPVDADRSVLFGHSMGGLFVANVLLRKPESFAGYLIGGLPIAGDPSLIERAKAVAPRGNGRRVFIGYVPDDIRRLRANEFTAPLSGPGSTFRVMEQNFTDEKHNSEILQLIGKGFRFLLPTDGSDKTAIAVKPEILQRYVGVYSSAPDRAWIVSRDGSRLFGTLKRGSREDRVELFAETETRFFARDAFVQCDFAMDAVGKAASVLVTLNEVATRAPRVN